MANVGGLKGKVYFGVFVAKVQLLLAYCLPLIAQVWAFVSFGEKIARISVIDTNAFPARLLLLLPRYRRAASQLAPHNTTTTTTTTTVLTTTTTTDNTKG